MSFIVGWSWSRISECWYAVVLSARDVWLRSDVVRVDWGVRELTSQLWYRDSGASRGQVFIRMVADGAAAGGHRDQK